MRLVLEQLQSELVTAYKNYLQAIQALAPDKQLQPGVSGAWTAKDVVAHLIGWDKALHEFISDPENFNPEPLYDVHTFNTTSVAKRQAQSWTEMVAELQNNFTQLQQAFITVPGEGRVYDRVCDWSKGRTADYKFHLEQLNEWLKLTQ